MRLDIEHLIAKSLKPHQVMHRLPRHSGHGEMAQKTQHHNFLLMHNVHAGWRDVVVPGRDFLRLMPVCASYNCRYKPPTASSSSWVPCSTNSPLLRTRMRSALCNVESRWAIMKVVRPTMSRSSASRMIASVLESTEEVGSSRMRMGAFFRNARATAILWRS